MTQTSGSDNGGSNLMEDRRCTARSKQSGERCKRWAIKGGTVCPMHGGKSSLVRAKAERRLVEAEAQRAAATYGLPVTVTPFDALLGELHRTAGHVAWLGELVANLEHRDDPEPTVLGDGGDRDPTEGRVSRSGLKQYTRTEKFTVEQESVWLRMYREERKHLAGVAAACLKAGVDERVVRLAEGQAELIASALRRFAELLGLDPRSTEVAAAARASLTLVEGGQAA